MSRWQIGDVRVTRIDERCAPYPPATILPSATPEGLDRYRDWLVPRFVDGDGNLLVSVHALAIESAGRRILVDTCIGETVPAGMPVEPEPAFLEQLAAAGFPRESIDIVLCTHLHFDHVGWNTIRQNGRLVPTFPNARYLFARREWEHWQQSEDRGYALTLDERVQPILDAGLADLVDTDHRLTDEVRLQPTPGHTPGHVSVAIRSRGVEALITGDMVFHPVQWAEPAWGSDADQNPQAACELRKSMRGTLCERDVLVIGTHFAPPTAGRLRKRDDQWRFETD